MDSMNSENKDLEGNVTRNNEGVDHKYRKEIRIKGHADICDRIAELNEKWQKSMENSRLLSEQMQAMLDEIKNQPTFEFMQTYTSL